MAPAGVVADRSDRRAWGVPPKGSRDDVCTPYRACRANTACRYRVQFIVCRDFRASGMAAVCRVWSGKRADARSKSGYRQDKNMVAVWCGLRVNIW